MDANESRLRELQAKIQPVVEAAKRVSRVKKSFARGQRVTVGGHEIVVTKGKAHLSFPAGVPVEWEGKGRK